MSLLNFEHYPGICLQGQSETTEVRIASLWAEIWIRDISNVNVWMLPMAFVMDWSYWNDKRGSNYFKQCLYKNLQSHLLLKQSFRWSVPSYEI
jgi:hypothetical protein